MKQEEFYDILENHLVWLGNQGKEENRANLSGADLRNIYSVDDLLSEAILYNADLRNAVMLNIDFSDADLKGADLRGTVLDGANLDGADLRYSNLRNASLLGSELSYANLWDADLTNADLTGAYLTWANWEGVRGLTVLSAQVNTSSENSQITYIKDLGLWTEGDFQGTLEEFKIYIETSYPCNDNLKRRYFRVINFLLTEADFEEDLGE
ncbi:pentapeptide repeat-containing protein [Listeria seeligeri]|uniref:pentapeptide repeat-containing protein n=1 Tax=Listeria seeligeri TaxID=1640 RepID=UPI001627B04F|nr:pentapeptide repeat-containing protein [Listeria seeligeri]EFS0529381.1 pentapeptide repeat-containing protein [Listeria monocytogenes]EFU8668361.1 pentapeptide repeat-containing protein [Listeria monocytogenes]MBC1744563.1 pentapeptide repeat-containing protein [Listeria seeligeri]MBC1934613.1 pentapeptide repeat-containing protein [Listeria seeligeri]MBF2551642.1 pentapeptide repeat-containing protein [Listeria seeligeri]